MKLLRGMLFVLVAVAGMGALASSAYATSPPNDDFADATVLSGKFALSDGNTVSATFEAGEMAHFGQTSTISAWYAWTAPESGTATVNTCSSFSNIRVQAYTGASVNALNQESVGACRISFDTVEGTAYHIVAYPQQTGQSGFFRLALRSYGPAPNDAFAEPQVITGNSASLMGTTAGATKQIGEPNHFGSTDKPGLQHLPLRQRNQHRHLHGNRGRLPDGTQLQLLRLAGPGHLGDHVQHRRGPADRYSGR